MEHLPQGGERGKSVVCITYLIDDKSNMLASHMTPVFGFSSMDGRLQRNKASREFSQFEKSIFLVPSGLLRFSESQNMKQFPFPSVKHWHVWKREIQV